MPEIVKAGHLFIAQPPLFKVAKGRSEVYLKDQGALDRYLVEAGLQGRVLETVGGARSDGDLRAIVDQALRLKNMMAFVPRRYDPSIIEQMALSGALNPALTDADRLALLEITAAKLQAGDADATWNVRVLEDGTVQFSRLWRGVTDVHEVDGRFLTGTEAHKLHSIAGPQAETYDGAVRLVKAGDVAGEEPDNDEADTPDTPDTQSDDAPAAVAEGAITRPSQLLDAVFAAGRKGLAISRYKGLGEMNPEQLWETTLDPENRILLQVKVEDADVTDEIFTRLMGDVVEPRREFIQNNALNVANLDV
jgi:DNA gyrase subunit B